MRIQDYLADGMVSAAKEAFKNAKAVPGDKVDWKPLDLGRSVLDQAREMAKCPDWAYSICSGEEPDWSEGAMSEQQKEMNTWDTVERCEQECNQRMERLVKLYREMPDERLKETKFLPFDGGRDFTMVEMMEYPRWNYNYHNGQINYIQTLYGDKEMH
jgi:hypothetical protein